MTDAAQVEGLERAVQLLEAERDSLANDLLVKQQASRGSLVARMTRVAASLQVPKRGTMRLGGQPIEYVRNDDLLDALRPALAREGIVLYVDQLDCQQSDKDWRVRVRCVLTDGIETLEGCWWGSSTGNLAVAQTYAVKYWLLKTFQVGGGDDDENNTAEPAATAGNGSKTAPAAARRAAKRTAPAAPAPVAPAKANLAAKATLWGLIQKVDAGDLDEARLRIACWDNDEGLGLPRDQMSAIDLQALSPTQIAVIIHHYQESLRLAAEGLDDPSSRDHIPF